MAITLAELRQAVRTSQDRGGAANALGLALAEINKHGQALKYFRLAVKLQPEQARYYNNCAQASLSLNQPEAAIRYFETSLKLAPDQTEAYYNLALIYADRLKAPDESKRMFERSIKNSPEHLMSYVSLCFLLVADQSAEEARQNVFNLLGWSAKPLNVHKGMARALLKYGRYEEARREHLLALAMGPDEADTLYWLGETELGLRCVDAATRYYRKAYEIAPKHPWARGNYLQHLIQLGDCKAAQMAYRSYVAGNRIEPPSGDSSLNAVPEWTGSSLQGKTILVINDIGDGDAIHFTRFASLLKQAGATVIVECGKSLKSAIRTMPGVDVVLSKFEKSPPIDYHCRPAFSSLLFDWTWETIGNQIPYINPPYHTRRKWRERLAGDGCLRVGLNWEGSLKSRNNAYARRGIPFEQLRPISEIRGVTLYSLQFGSGAEALREGPGRFNIQDLNVGDYLDTAGAVLALDLIITVDTSLAHLAGALGKPSFLMLPFVSCWRWMMDREDTPWYPSTRLFRQGQPGNWADVISKVCQATRSLVSHKMLEGEALPLQRTESETNFGARRIRVS
jgi:tetratricopeptide (TPR) repeat protein